MLPAFPAVESLKMLLLSISESLATVSVPTFKVMLPAGAAPRAPARMTASARASVCAVIVMVAGVLVEVPPLIPVVIMLWSRLTLVAGLPEPVTP